MGLIREILAFATLLAFAPLGPVVSLAAETTLNSTLQNANHIFNAIHSSLRQWGSSLNHNGMSFFLATVPLGTELYHGNGNESTVTGMEWLAFEPEHALAFAHGIFRPPPPKAPNSTAECLQEQWKCSRFTGQKVLNPNLENEIIPPGPEMPGWLHTYRTKKDLRLLYIDGMSAGKTTNGTLDSQDYVLLGNESSFPILGDYQRAKGLCSLASNEWSGRIEGFLRMEAGFEVILCDFESNLEEIHVLGTGNALPNTEAAFHQIFAYIRAVADRYNGIGGGRATLDYDRFITAYAYDLPLFKWPGSMPRLEDLPLQELALIRNDLTSIIMAEGNGSDPHLEQFHNWQATADMIVTRYASRLKYLTSKPVAGSNSILHIELAVTLRPFIAYDARNETLEVERCTNHFIPISPPMPQSIASIVVREISQKICSTLSSALSATEALKTYETSVDEVDSRRLAAIALPIDQLIEYLGWSVWKECGGCRYDETCFIPIWPWGTREDYENPSCVNATGFRSRRGYWGRPGPIRRPPDSPPERSERESNE